MSDSCRCFCRWFYEAVWQFFLRLSRTRLLIAGSRDVVKPPSLAPPQAGGGSGGFLSFSSDVLPFSTRWRRSDSCQPIGDSLPSRLHRRPASGPCAMSRARAPTKMRISPRTPLQEVAVAAHEVVRHRQTLGGVACIGLLPCYFVLRALPEGRPLGVFRGEAPRARTPPLELPP